MSSAGNVSTSSLILTVGMPRRRNRSFSVSRSWAASSASASGTRAHAACRLDRDVLELVGDDLGAVGEPVEELGIVVLADQQLADVAGRRVRRRIEETEREAERDPRKREHPPQLAAADDADDHASSGSGLASTDSVWASR